MCEKKIALERSFRKSTVKPKVAPIVFEIDGSASSMISTRSFNPSQGKLDLEAIKEALAQIQKEDKNKEATHLVEQYQKQRAFLAAQVAYT